MSDADLTGSAPDEGVPIEAAVDVPQEVTNQAPAAPEPEPKPASLRETILKADADIKSRAEKAKVEAKSPEADSKEPIKKDAKAEAKDKPEVDTKIAKAEPEAKKDVAEEATSARAGDEPRQSEGRKPIEPPARFLPEAKESWRNVPHQVKAEVNRITSEYDAEIEQSRAARERYEAIKQYDELARSNGRELKDSLAKMAEVENNLARNPIAALDMILREAGPRKADGSPLTIREVAEFVLSRPPQQEQTAAQQPDLEQIVTTVAERLSQQQAQQQQITQLQTVIDQFSQQHPQFNDPEVQSRVTALLSSGVIDQFYGSGLTPEQKLNEAFRMAVGNAASRPDPEPAPEYSQPAPRAANPAGRQSISGAPGSSDAVSRKAPSPSIRAALERARAKVG